MTVELTVTSITVQPEISAANVVVTPTFSSGGGLTAPILSISKNGVNIAPDEFKNVDIEVPTKTSDITNDSDFVSDAEYVHTDNNYDNAAVQEVAKIVDKQDVTDALLETDSNTIVGAINEVNSIAKGANQALSFNDYQAVIAAMLVSGLNAGQNLYIDKLDVPDLWVKAVETTSVPYAYVSDTQFVIDVLAGTQIGYYRLALLETQKVDLTNYYTKDETDQAIEDYAEPLRTTDQNYVSDAELEVLQDTSGVNTGDETQDSLGEKIELTELETVTDNTKIAASDSAFLKWFSGATLKTFLNNVYGRLATTNTWSLLQTFTSGLKTTKIIPNSDTTGVAIRNAADTSDVVKVDTANNRICVGGSNPKSNIHIVEAVPQIRLSQADGANGANSFVFGYSSTDNQFMIGAKSGDSNMIALSGGDLNFGTVETGNTTQLLRFTVLKSGSINLIAGKYDYHAASKSADTINDTRTSNVAGVKIEEICTLGSATKGSGTWVVKSIEGAEKALTNNVSANILDINCAVNTMQCGIIEYSISAIDTVSNTVRSHIGYMSYNVRNQNGTITTQLLHPATLENDLGTISDTWAMTNGTNKATLSLTANAAGMTPTSMTLYFDVKNQGRNTVTLL